MDREHYVAPAGRTRACFGTIALAAALAVTASACSSSNSKPTVVGQDATSSAGAVGAPTSAASSAASTGKSAAASSAGDAKSSAPAAPAANGSFKVGQAVKVGDYTVTVHKVTYPYSNDYDQPTSGKAYVLLDVEVANSGKESQSFSSLMQLGLKDSTNTNYDETIVMGVDGTPPDGDIAVGKSLRGPVAFEVPAGAKGLRFSFLPELNGDKTLIDLGK